MRFRGRNFKIVYIHIGLKININMDIVRDIIIIQIC